MHHPPLVLKGFSYISDNEMIISLVYALVDVITALQIAKINCLLRNSRLEEQRKDRSYRIFFPDWILMAAYLFNPLSLLSLFSRSTIVFTNALTLCAIASINNCKTSLFFLSAAAYTAYYPWYLIFPVASHLRNNTGVSGYKSLGKSLVVFAGFLSLWLTLSYFSAGSLGFLDATYGTIIRFKKIAPNVGLWWYFFTEIFDFFHDFYIAVFNLYTLIFVIPLTLRFNKKPLFVIWLTLGLLSFGKAYPTVGDFNIYFSMVLLWRPLFRYLSFNLVLTALVVGCLLTLLPIFYYVWIDLNSGNANFFYAIGVVFKAVEALMLSDFIWSELQDDFFKKTSFGPCKLTQVYM